MTSKVKSIKGENYGTKNFKRYEYYGNRTTLS